ncbi:uncharacterized protein FFM5_14444 [Fusarium fujikuroi]|nr:uncharacterized protein FFM5_14444 [Fusarium fujikuroi]
MHKIAIDKK